MKAEKIKLIVLALLVLGIVIVIVSRAGAEVTWNSVDVQTVKIEAVAAVTVWDSIDGHTAPAQRITLTNSTGRGQLQIDVVNNAIQYTLTTYSKAWCQTTYEIETCYHTKSVQNSLDGLVWQAGPDEVVTF